MNSLVLQKFPYSPKDSFSIRSAIFRPIGDLRFQRRSPAATHAVGVREGNQVESRILAGLLAGSLIVAPMTIVHDALAVSGGGGISNALSGADFTGQDLRKNSYTKAVLRQTNFTNCNLQQVSFFGSIAKEAIFKGANLSFADLESADLEGADLTDAILEGAFVNNAQFINVKIDNTDWTDVVLRKDVQAKLCNIAQGTNPITDVDTRESLFCP